MKFCALLLVSILNFSASGACIDLSGTYTFLEPGFEPLTLKYDMVTDNGIQELRVVNMLTGSEDRAILDGERHSVGATSYYEAFCEADQVIIKEYEMDVLAQESYSRLDSQGNLHIIFKAQGEPDLEATGIRN